MNIIEIDINEYGQPAGPTQFLPSHSSVGSYPLLYLAEGWKIHCAICAAHAELHEGIETEAHARYEGEPVECETCGSMIDSAYG